MQFNISESSYRHGDRVDFFVDDMVLTRFVHPVIAGFDLPRKILYSADRRLPATYTLMGRQGMADVTLRLALDGHPAAQLAAPASREGELALPIAEPLAPGNYRAVLTLQNAKGAELDRCEADFRVIEGPFR